MVDDPTKNAIASLKAARKDLLSRLTAVERAINALEPSNGSAPAAKAGKAKPKKARRKSAEVAPIRDRALVLLDEDPSRTNTQVFDMVIAEGLAQRTIADESVVKNALVNERLQRAAIEEALATEAETETHAFG